MIWKKSQKKPPQEYEILKPQNIHSLIAVPIYTNHKFIGFIGLDNPDLNQDMVSMNLLSDVGCHMGSVRENLRMMKVLEQEHNNLEKKPGRAAEREEYSGCIKH